MRQKKSKTIFYILILMFFLVIGFMASRDLNVNVEHVEETVQNDISKN